MNSGHVRVVRGFSHFLYYYNLLSNVKDDVGCQ